MRKALSVLSPTLEKKIPILMYHSISCSATPKFKPFTVSPKLFAAQMTHLRRHAYTPITVTHFVDALLQGRSPSFQLPARPVILTFDDGFADFFTEVFPVLKHHGFAATLYIATAFINGTSRWLQHEGESRRLMLTWDQLAEISAHGIECGAHSHSHPQLDILPYALARDEILQSKRLLEEHLGHEVFSFAYPFGYHTARVRQSVREAGFTSACAVRHAMSSETDDPFSLARLIVRPDSTMQEFSALLTGRISSPAALVGKIYAQVRTPLWQVARRCTVPVKQYLYKIGQLELC